MALERSLDEAQRNPGKGRFLDYTSFHLDYLLTTYSIFDYSVFWNYEDLV
jgi:hypothetical protein